MLETLLRSYQSCLGFSRDNSLYYCCISLRYLSTFEMKENITVSLLRNTSCLSVSESKKEEQKSFSKVSRCLHQSWSPGLTRKKHFYLIYFKNPEEVKVNVWKTFKEAVDEEQEIVRKLYQTGLNVEKSLNKSEKLSVEPSKIIPNKTSTMAVRSNSSVSDIYRRAKAKLPKIQPKIRINKDESIKILIKTAEKQKEIESSKVGIGKKKTAGKSEIRDTLPSLPLEIYFNQDFRESSFISIANRPLPPLPK